MLLLLSGLAAPAEIGPRSPAAEKQVAAAAAAYAAAVEKGDEAALGALLDDDFEIVASDGERRNKAQEIEDLRVPEGVKTTYFRFEIASIRAWADAGIATGVLDWGLAASGKKLTHRRAVTAVFLRTARGWKLAAQHTSALP